MLIKDTNQKTRAARPEAHGMWGGAAEILQQHGIDPRDHAERIRSSFAARSTVVGRRMIPQVPALAGVQELAIDHSDVIQREVLQQTALEAVDAGFMAEELAPSQLIAVKKGIVYLDDQVEDRRQVDDSISTRGKATEVNEAVTSVNVDMQPHTLEGSQPRRDAAIAPMLASFARVVDKTSRKAKLQHEIRVKTALMTAANYAAANRRALTSDYQWNGGSSADPLADMQATLGALFGPVTHAQMSLEAWQAVQQNEFLQGILSGYAGNQGVIRVMDFAMFFGIANVHVDEQRFTAIGASALSRLYDSDKIALLSVSARPDSRTFLRNFMFRQGAGGFVTLTWFTPDGSHGTDWVKITHENDLVVVDNTYGAIITGMRA